MQKVVLKLDMRDEKDKENAMEIVSGFAGVESIDMNMEENKLTVTGDLDPVKLATMLSKVVSTRIISVGPANEAQKDDNGSNKSEQSEDLTSDPAEGEGDVSVGIERLNFPPFMNSIKSTMISSVKFNTLEKKMPKAVLQLDVHDEKHKEKATKIVSGIAGVHSISTDMENKKMTVTGAVDAEELVTKLRKIAHTGIISVGPVREGRDPPPLYHYGRYVYDGEYGCVIC